jgi:hypothetical protein
VASKKSAAHIVHDITDVPLRSMHDITDVPLCSNIVHDITDVPLRSTNISSTSSTLASSLLT